MGSWCWCPSSSAVWCSFPFCFAGTARWPAPLSSALSFRCHFGSTLAFWGFGPPNYSGFTRWWRGPSRLWRTNWIGWSFRGRRRSRRLWCWSRKIPRIPAKRTFRNWTEVLLKFHAGKYRPCFPDVPRVWPEFIFIIYRFKDLYCVGSATDASCFKYINTILNGKFS